MKLLLDTHTFIWFVEDAPQLPANVKKLIENPQNEIFLSIVSLWEMAIKIQLKKLVISKSIEEIIHLLAQNGFILLPVIPIHIVRLSQLEFHHRDPFDRMIIAQGLTEQQKIVGKDIIFDKYNANRIWE
ncbi:MAG: type II toxin-antitoxin system VapC family toxin [Bacteroidales bacterium]|nr:type II toxin-antitoxin system VapC family toxin [Bacteroidales bacterium]